MGNIKPFEFNDMIGGNEQVLGSVRKCDEKL